MINVTRQKLSLLIKSLIALLSFLGIALAMLFAVRDGYSHWAPRLLYFTQQSNVWIGITALLSLVFSPNERMCRPRIKRLLYCLKFIFTVSITLTGIVFCALLAPFADNNPWTLSSILTHVAVPLLSIADLFLDPYQTVRPLPDVPLSLLPPLFYFFVSYLLGQAGVDFGKGDPYPYFFLNFHSEVGLWGFADGNPPQIGSGYWIVSICLLILIIAFLYATLLKRHKKQ